MTKRITYLGPQEGMSLPPFGDDETWGLSPNQARNPVSGDTLTFELNRPMFIDETAEAAPAVQQFFTDVIGWATNNADFFLVEDVPVATGTAVIKQDASPGIDHLPPMPPMPPQLPTDPPAEDALVTGGDR